MNLNLKNILNAQRSDDPDLGQAQICFWRSLPSPLLLANVENRNENVVVFLVKHYFSIAENNKQKLTYPTLKQEKLCFVLFQITLQLVFIFSNTKLPCVQYMNLILII